MKATLILGTLWLGAIFSACGPAGSLGERRQAAVAADDAFEWEVRWDVPGQTPIGQYLGLRNFFLPGGQSIQYYRHIYGIEMVFTGDETRNVRFESKADLPVITEGELVSIEVRSARPLRYQPRDDGVSLGWSDDFAYEWQVLTRPGEAVLSGTRVRLHNTSAGADLVYCPRTQGIALGWSTDCIRDDPTDPTAPTE